MGWTSVCARYYSNNLVDRLKECHEVNTSMETEKYPGYKVVSETLRGTTYYALVEITNSKERRKYTVPVTMLTSVQKNSEFYYKEITSYDFPPSFLSALPNTISNASYKEDCLICDLENKQAKERKEKKKLLSELAYGSEITFTLNEKLYHLVKCPPAYQFKKDWWMIVDISGTHYFQKRSIPLDFKVVKDMGRTGKKKEVT